MNIFMVAIILLSLFIFTDQQYMIGFGHHLGYVGTLHIIGVIIHIGGDLTIV